MAKRTRLGAAAAAFAAVALLLAACADQSKIGNCEPGVSGLSQTMSMVPKSNC